MIYDKGPWTDELQKFFKKDVEVTYMAGKVRVTEKGQLRAYHPNYLTVVIMTDKEKIIIRNPLTIRRRRTYDPKKKK